MAPVAPTPATAKEKFPSQTEQSIALLLAILAAVSPSSVRPVPAAQAPAISGSPLISEVQLMAWVGGIIPQIMTARDMPTILAVILT